MFYELKILRTANKGLKIESNMKSIINQTFNYQSLA